MWKSDGQLEDIVRSDNYTGKTYVEIPLLRDKGTGDIITDSGLEQFITQTNNLYYKKSWLSHLKRSEQCCLFRSFFNKIATIF